MTKRDSLLAGFTYPSSSMSMPRRHSWRSRSHGHPSSTAAPSDPFTPSRSDTDPTASDAGPSLLPAGSGDHTSHYGYSTADTATPIPAPADHQTPILPRLEEEAYPLQMELAETRRQLHAYYFVEVQTPQADNSQPALRRLMVTEVDRRGVHRNRQPEFFFNGIIGHIRAGRNGWIDSWDQSTQLANYWRRYFQIPEMPPDGNWHPYHHEAPESPVSVQGSGMDDTDSIAANVDITPPPVQIQQLAPSSGTFSTMTGMPTWQYSNDSRIQMMTWQDIRSRSSRQQTWLTLPVTWQNLPAHCQIKPFEWRHFPTSAIEPSRRSEL